MDVAIMRRLVLEADTHQIDDKVINAANIQSMSDIDSLIKTWDSQKKQAWSNPDAATVDKNISDWSKGKA